MRTWLGIPLGVVLIAGYLWLRPGDVEAQVSVPARGNCSSENASCSVASLTSSGAISGTTGTFSSTPFAFTGTGANTITSAATDATTSSTVAALTFQSTVALTSGDLAFEFNNSAGNPVFTISGIGTAVATSLTASSLLRTPQINPVSTATALYLASEQTAAAASTTVAAFRLHAATALDATDLHTVWHASDGTTKLMELAYNGGLTVSGTTTSTGAIIASSALTKGTYTLTTGSATVTVVTGAQCVCGLSVGTVWPKCAVSGTTLTITGTGSDTGTYICL